MAGLLDNILSGNNPTIANINAGFDTASIIKTCLGLLSVGLFLIMFGWLANKKPLIALGIACLTILATFIYFNNTESK